MSRLGRRCAAVAFGLAVDRVLGDPSNRWHPVAWFGSLMTAWERRWWADSRLAGIAYTCSGVVVGAAAGRLVDACSATAIAVGGRSLTLSARAVGQPLSDGDPQRAKEQLSSLVGRNPEELDESGVAAAVVESVAENSVDAVFAPAMWAVIAGAPGALIYRAVNTMDAMVGHRNERYGHFGWASARLDDLANLLPARAFALSMMTAHPKAARDIADLVRRDGRAHLSPNAGVAEVPMAAVLGVELGGPLRYGDRIEDRARLGRGPRPTPADIERSIDAAQRAQLVLGVILGVVALADVVLGRSLARQRAAPGG